MAGSQTFNVEIDFVAKNQELFDKANKQAKETAATAKSIKTAYAEYHDELAALNPELVKQLDLEKQQAQAMEKTKQATKNLQLEARNLKAQIREANAELRILKDTARDIDLVAKPLAIGGALITGGIFKAANDAVKNAKEGTEADKEWKAAQESLNKSYQQFGQVAVQEALPILQKSAELAKKIADFAQSHPEVVGAVLRAGEIGLVLGTIGKAVSSGIRLVADFKQDAVAELQLEAARLQLAASNNQIEAAGIQAEASGTKGLGKASPLAAIGIPALVVAGAVGGLTLLDKGIEAVQKRLESISPHLSGFSGSMHLLENILLPGPAAAAKFIENFHKIPDELNFISEKIKQFTGIDLGKIGGTTPAATDTVANTLLGGSQDTQDKLVAAYAKYKDEDLALVEKHYADRQDIIASALTSEKTADATLASAIAGAISKEADQVAKLTADYNKNELRAEQDYQDQRMKIASSGGDEILKLEQDSQDRIRKIHEEFGDKEANDRNKRDALALAADKKQETKAVSDEVANTNKEIKRRNADIALRLHELDVQFAKEKQRREQDYEEQVAQAQQQEADTIKQAQATHDAEIKRIQAEEQDKLKKLDDAFNAERTARYKAFVQQINDLDKYLLGMSSAMDASYAANLASLNQFIYNTKQAFASLNGGSVNVSGYSTGGGLASPTSTAQTGPTTTQTGGLNQIITSAWQSFLSSIGIHDEGGYMYKGIAKVAWNGVPEFAFSGANTRAAENIVSGKLTQQNALAAMQRGAQSPNMTLNYIGRFEGEVTNAMRRAVKKDIDQSLSTFLAKAAV